MRLPTLREIGLFIRLSRLHFVVGSLLLYGLGAALAAYRGARIDTGLYLLGQAIVLSLQLMNHYFNEYFDVEVDRINPRRTWLSGGSGALAEGGLPPKVAMYAGFTALTIAAMLSGLLLVTGRAGLASWLFLLLIFAGAYFYNVPPVRLVGSGFGELTAALVVSGFVPALAFTLQLGTPDRLLLLSTLPLVAANFAMLLMVELPDYASNSAADKQNLMVRLGWLRGMRVHDAALALAFMILGAGYFLGLPYRVAVGPLLALPLGVAQVWTLWRIRGGAPPRWSLLTANAVVILGLMAYLELVGYLLT